MKVFKILGELNWLLVGASCFVCVGSNIAHSEVLEVADVQTKLREVSGDAEFRQFLSEILGRSSDPVIRLKNTANLIRAISDSQQEQFYPFIREQANTGAGTVRYIAEVARMKIAWMQETPSERIARFVSLLKSDAGPVTKHEVVREMCLEGVSAREFFENEYREYKVDPRYPNAPEKDRLWRSRWRNAILLGVVLCRLDVGTEIIEYSIAHESDLAMGYVSHTLGVNFDEIYWEIKGKGLEPAAEIRSLIDGLCLREQPEIKDSFLGQGAYRRLSRLGKKTLKYLVDVVCDSRASNFVRIQCVRLVVIEIGDAGAIERMERCTEGKPEHRDVKVYLEKLLETRSSAGQEQ